ncbi:DUF2281 domain-containing protein [Nostoc sp. ChiQUE01b]|uniref:DUF2281 domain-containing protein n=1 Tax=Nostoc sp. ChiQUE01b TaxID=3075376 RepID=UPI002AD1E893|nr:DUF2281 domain-containing protein [Nostoc sp. ChiQUE01b]MDZ8261096.1 DUF2281 domain-containing protein [Nostoc sp. ChiQUE01b]
MTIRDTAIAKLQELPEPLLQEVSDFIDFVVHKHQAKTVDTQQDETLKAWSRWFEAVDRLDTSLPEPASEYQQLLLNKYRQQGLEL